MPLPNTVKSPYLALPTVGICYSYLAILNFRICILPGSSQGQNVFLLPEHYQVRDLFLLPGHSQGGIVPHPLSGVDCSSYLGIPPSSYTATIFKPTQ
jgi:hypothetical protein